MELQIRRKFEEILEDEAAGNPESVVEFQDLDCPAIARKRNCFGQTLLHYAAGCGRPTLVSYLVSRGADVNAKDSEGRSPLHSSCFHKHFTTTKLLLNKGADANIVDLKGWTPMHYLLSREVREDKISARSLELINLLISFDADPTIKTLNNAHDCITFIRNRDDKIGIKLRFLTQKLNNESDQDIRESLIDRYLNEYEYFYLIKRGDGNLDSIKSFTTRRLLSSHISCYDGITPLHRAAGHNQLETAKFFVEMGAQVSAIDQLGRIPLHNAAEYGHVEMIELLVAKGSDINSQDSTGLSPLHVAASTRTFAACLKLIELGANVNLVCKDGLKPYELAESDDIREVLKPTMTERFVQSSSGQGIYMDIGQDDNLPVERPLTLFDDELSDLMLDSSSPNRLFSNTKHTIKKIPLPHSDIRFQKVKKRILETIMTHTNDAGGRFTSYDILSIDLLLHEKVWSKYKLMCQKLEIDYGVGSKNEILLFHGSNFIDKIQAQGFDERYAQRNGMFGAGIYFAKHSSKSNQYTFGWGRGCQDHNDKSCYVCERRMILAQVALGKTLISREAMPECAHAPPGYSSVSGLPESTDNLLYPEYVIYSGDQAYPLFLIRYKIKNL